MLTCQPQLYKKRMHQSCVQSFHCPNVVENKHKKKINCNKIKREHGHQQNNGQSPCASVLIIEMSKYRTNIYQLLSSYDVSDFILIIYLIDLTPTSSSSRFNSSRRQLQGFMPSTQGKGQTPSRPQSERWWKPGRVCWKPATAAGRDWWTQLRSSASSPWFET